MLSISPFISMIEQSLFSLFSLMSMILELLIREKKYFLKFLIIYSITNYLRDVLYMLVVKTQNDATVAACLHQQFYGAILSTKKSSIVFLVNPGTRLVIYAPR